MNPSPEHTPGIGIPRGSYVTGGRATFTIVSGETGNRFTYAVRKGKDETAPHFVRAKVGSTFIYLGTIFKDGTYSHGRKSQILPDEQVARAFSWFWKHPESAKVEFLPSGRCCCCGKTLTTPESIALGVGPECRKKIQFLSPQP